MFDSDTLISLWLFIAFMVGTPGPANILIMSAGAQFGFMRSISFNAGLVSGKLILNVALALGLLGVLADHQSLQVSLKYVSAGFLIILALRNWSQIKRPKADQKNLGFIHGLFVHPLNPKAWVMLILAWTEFGPTLGNWQTQFFIIAISFMVAQIIFHSFWCFIGTILKHAMSNSLGLSRGLIVLNIAVVLWVVSS